MTDFASRLATLRHQRHLSISDAATRMRREPRIWRAYEAGEKKPNEDSLAMIVRALGLTPDELHFLVTGQCPAPHEKGTENTEATG